jgi:hypothetical protein
MEIGRERTKQYFPALLADRFEVRQAASLESPFALNALFQLGKYAVVANGLPDQAFEAGEEGIDGAESPARPFQMGQNFHVIPFTVGHGRTSNPSLQIKHVIDPGRLVGG